MTEMRMRPKTDYLKTADWEQLYILTEHWHSDMGFYMDELRFLHKLVDQYFMWITMDENRTKANAIAIDIRKTQQEAIWLKASIEKHLKHISDLVKHRTARDDAEFREEHILLEDHMVDFAKLFRKLKAEVFAVTEFIMETEELPDRFMEQGSR